MIIDARKLYCDTLAGFPDDTAPPTFGGVPVAHFHDEVARRGGYDHVRHCAKQHRSPTSADLTEAGGYDGCCHDFECANEGVYVVACETVPLPGSGQPGIAVGAFCADHVDAAPRAAYVALLERATDADGEWLWPHLLDAYPEPVALLDRH